MQGDTGGDGLDPLILRQLQRLMRNYNPYASAFKACGQRLEEDQSGAQAYLKQHDPSRMLRGTHNKPTSSEVAAVIVMDESGNPDVPIRRDIAVQTHGGELRRIPFWHSSYMPLRYPLVFPCGEQSWMDSLPLRGHQNSRNLLARRAPPSLPTIEEDADEDQPEAVEALAEEEIHDDAPCGRGGSKRVTQKDFYQYWLQVSKPGGEPPPLLTHFFGIGPQW